MSHEQEELYVVNQMYLVVAVAISIFAALVITFALFLIQLAVETKRHQ